MDIKQAIAQVIEGNNLSRDQMDQVMTQIMTGEATPSQIGGFLIGLRMKGETVDEIVAAAEVMRKLVTPVQLDSKNLVDTCGTGGDESGIFNVSTASAIVVAAAGGQVAKHGNRSVSSNTGSADVLEQAGVNLQLNADQVARCVQEVGVGFMFAPAHHSAMKHAIGPRKEMAVRTIFNLLGPLTNPAGAPNQVLGVFSEQWLRPLAEVLKALGSEHVLVVNSEDGLDEISTAAPTRVAELKNGEIREYMIQPEDFGITRKPLDSMKVDNATESLALIEKALKDEGGAASDILALNGGAAIYAANICGTLEQGVEMAQDLLASGQAREKLSDLITFSQSV
ncbi:MAG: anthranilate phosphoribosyltransferase [Pseudomonadales bacterium]|nr:anthranilate phosphoribosyltransferase [Pseudomonadales bacterium]